MLYPDSEDIAFENCETCPSRHICYKLSYCTQEEYE